MAQSNNAEGFMTGEDRLIVSSPVSHLLITTKPKMQWPLRMGIDHEQLWIILLLRTSIVFFFTKSSACSHELHSSHTVRPRFLYLRLLLLVFLLLL